MGGARISADAEPDIFLLVLTGGRGIDPEGESRALLAVSLLGSIDYPTTPCPDDVIPIVGDSGPLDEVLGRRESAGSEPVAVAAGPSAPQLLSEVAQVPCDHTVAPQLASFMNVPAPTTTSPPTSSELSCDDFTVTGTEPTSGTPYSTISYTCPDVPDDVDEWEIDLAFTVPSAVQLSADLEYVTSSKQTADSEPCTHLSEDSISCPQGVPAANIGLTQQWQNFAAGGEQLSTCGDTVDVTMTATPPDGGTAETIGEASTVAAC
jgi:hypothetical protein